MGALSWPSLQRRTSYPWFLRAGETGFTLLRVIGKVTDSGLRHACVATHDNVDVRVPTSEFIDSSLDFELFVRVSHALAMSPGHAHARFIWEIEGASTFAGIAIPFPQHDLHIRSGRLHADLARTQSEAAINPTARGNIATMNFISQLSTAWSRSNSLLCVGLDPDTARFPAHLRGQPDAILQFCCAIVDATADLVCAFKPQIAYFSAHRAEAQLEALIAHIHAHHPGIPVILDAKRGDIGSTAEQYASEAFERYRADAVTVNPYMGRDSVAPWLAHEDKGVILLCRTSNPGGGDIQNQQVGAGGTAIYEHVAELVARQWNTSGQCALVVGATYPDEIRRVRQIVGDMPLLVPGIGAQGGDIEATVNAGKTTAGTGLMINSSRAILFASAGEDFASAARAAALATRDAINASR